MSEPNSINPAVYHHQNHYICGGAFQLEDTYMKAADTCSVITNIFTEKVNAVEVSEKIHTAFYRATVFRADILTG